MAPNDQLAESGKLAETDDLEQRARPFQALYEHWERNQWSPQSLDFSRDRSSFLALEGERRDALAGAADCVIAVEARCRDEQHLVGTVGRMVVEPGVGNTIPGRVRFTLDLRAPDDAQRLAALADIQADFNGIAARRNLDLGVSLLHEAGAVPCDPGLTALIRDLADLPC